MRIFSPVFVHAYTGRILNIHPALLPSFPGAHAHGDALAYGVKVSGCTVHFVDEGRGKCRSFLKIKDGGNERWRLKIGRVIGWWCSAAKNHASVTVVVDPADYAVVLEELASKDETTYETHQHLAAKICH